MTAIAEYDDLDGLALAALVRAGEVAPLELVDEAIRRAEAVGVPLGAVVAPMYQHARDMAQRTCPDKHDPKTPFAGVPFLLKDLLACAAGAPMQSGGRFYRGHVPAHDSEIVRRYRAAGLIPIGKSATAELGIVPTVETLAHGACKNPWDLARSAGGSSGALLKHLTALDPSVDQVYAYLPWTPVFNVTGQPAMSVPLHWSPAGLPIGVHFVGRHGDEATLLRLAGQLEQARPWAHRRPDLSALRT